MSKINIAIDGHSSCGKSTLAKDLAKSIGYTYIDSGAMYRAVALYFLNNKIKPDSPQAIESLDKILLDLKTIDGKFNIFLQGKNVTERIIALDVSSIVSQVAAISEVRRKLVEIQQELGKNKGVVMDGRDIGSVVFPDAELKLFVTANIEVRTYRRFLELEQKNMPSTFEEVQANLLKRDHIDSSRADSPLTLTEGAVLIDNSYMDKEEQLYLVKKLVDERIN